LGKELPTGFDPKRKFTAIRFCDYGHAQGGSIQVDFKKALLTAVAFGLVGGCAPRPAEHRPDDIEARKRAALAGDKRASNDVVTWYSEHSSQYRRQERMKWYAVAAHNNDSFGAEHYGNELHNAGDCPGAAKWYERARDMRRAEGDVQGAEVEQVAVDHIRREHPCEPVERRPGLPDPLY
jgi:hypothetical protein